MDANTLQEYVSDLDRLRGLLFRRLEGSHKEFVEKMRFVREKRREGEKWFPSGVLVPLEVHPDREETVFVLNKRSDYVQQPGDLCCPGGGADRRLDRLLANLLVLRFLPSTWSSPFGRLLRLDRTERDILLFILAGGLRESWEEMRLKPWNVEYLGALPTHEMGNFRRVIFPVVGRIRHKWKPRPNWEVEKLIRLPLDAFFQIENYAICRIVLPSEGREQFGVDSYEVPCMVLESEGEEEILWGATFRILLTFMSKVFDLPVDRINPTRKIQKVMPEHYYTGKHHPEHSKTG